jgi:hypothetical protein
MARSISFGDATDSFANSRTIDGGPSPSQFSWPDHPASAGFPQTVHLSFSSGLAVSDFSGPTSDLPGSDCISPSLIFQSGRFVLSVLLGAAPIVQRSSDVPIARGATSKAQVVTLIAASLGGLILLAVVIVVLVFFYRRRRQPPTHLTEEEDMVGFPSLAPETYFEMSLHHSGENPLNETMDQDAWETPCV